MTRLRRIALATLALAFLASAALPEAHARGIDLLKRLDKHFTETVEAVKATDDPAEKRTLLNESFQTLTLALHEMERVPRLSDEDHATLAALQADVRAKQLRLNGFDGQPRVPDAQLNNFADAAQNSFALQNRTITLSLTTALLILIILILIL